MDDHTLLPPNRFTWAKLNADTLFLGLLAFASGIFDLIDPSRDAIVHASGDPRPLFYVRACAYLIAGAILILALVTQSVRAEALARGILIGGIALNLYRYAHWLGWETSTWAQVILLVLIGVTTHLRMSVLLGSAGLRVTRSAGETR